MRLLSILSAFLFTAAGCSAGGTGAPAPDQQSDSYEVDASLDLSGDTSSLNPDLPRDTSVDDTSDTAADVSEDTLADAAQDVAPDSTQDTTPDTSQDAAPDTDLGTSTDTAPDAAQDTSADTGVDATADLDSTQPSLCADVVCEDEDLCNGTELCDPETGACVPGEPLECDFGEDCMIYSCDPDVGCMVSPACDDGDPCTNDICDPVIGFCDVEHKDCDDDILCTVDSCDSETGECQNVFKQYNNAICDDGLACTQDQCKLDCGPFWQGPGNPATCTNYCTHEEQLCFAPDWCEVVSCSEEQGGCFYEEDDCDDNNVCTEDSCQPLIGCINAPITCDDDILCSVDSCDPQDGCQHDLVTVGIEECDDGVPCTDDICDLGDGACIEYFPVPGAPDICIEYAQEYVCQNIVKTCDDDVECTVDSCDETTGTCFNEATVSVCNDNDPCTQDSCDAAGNCDHTDKICDDSNPCTTDSCNESDGQCVNTPIVCNDGDACNGLETCNLITGLCTPGTSVQCSDNNLCNGQEYCIPSTGQCVNGPPVTCPDFNPCDGVDYCNPVTGGCVSPSQSSCPQSPDKCGESGGLGGIDSGAIVETVADGFTLRDVDEWAEKYEILEDIEAHWSTTPTSLQEIVFYDDFNRSASAITVPGLDCFYSGFQWNSGDGKVDYWWPQGVTGSATGCYEKNWADACGTASGNSAGKVFGSSLLLVSWYHKAEEDSSTSTYKGARISIVDVSYINDMDYRHALLVEPIIDSNGNASFKGLASASSSKHAGGIAWYKNYLYMADTGYGFRVFDLSRIMQVQTGDTNKLGYISNSSGYHAYNYKYVIPQVGKYVLCEESCCARFSFVSVDLSSSPPALVAGEYESFTDSLTPQGRVHVWPLNPETGKLAIQNTVVHPEEVVYAGVTNMQGALRWNGNYFISSSRPKTSWPLSSGTLYHGGVGDDVEEHQYPTLPEDLHYNSFWDALWSCTEKPNSFLGNTRYCFYFKMADVLAGCD